MKKVMLAVLVLLTAVNLLACSTRVERLANGTIKTDTYDPQVARTVADPNSDYSSVSEKACAELVKQGKAIAVLSEGQFMCIPLDQNQPGAVPKGLQTGIWENYLRFDIIVNISSQGNPRFNPQTMQIKAGKYVEILLLPGIYNYTIRAAGYNGRILAADTFTIDGIGRNAVSNMAHKTADFVRSTY